MFRTVRELAPPNLGGIATVLGDRAYFFAACLGLVLLLPERGWRAWHWVVFIGGLDLYVFAAATATHWSPLAVVAVLARPLVAAAALRVLVAPDGDAREPRERGRLVIAVWFLATLLQAYQGTRFVLLLVPPAGLLLGVALGGCTRHSCARRRRAPVAGRPSSGRCSSSPSPSPRSRCRRCGAASRRRAPPVPRCTTPGGTR